MIILLVAEVVHPVIPSPTVSVTSPSIAATATALSPFPAPNVSVTVQPLVSFASDPDHISPVCTPAAEVTPDTNAIPAAFLNFSVPWLWALTTLPPCHKCIAVPAATPAPCCVTEYTLVPAAVKSHATTACHPVVAVEALVKSHPLAPTVQMNSVAIFMSYRIRCLPCARRCPLASRVLPSQSSTCQP